MIETVGGPLAGVWLNNINIMRDDYYYYITRRIRTIIRRRKRPRRWLRGGG
jgi:hypothetical protein